MKSLNYRHEVINDNRYIIYSVPETGQDVYSILPCLTDTGLVYRVYRVPRAIVHRKEMASVRNMETAEYLVLADYCEYFDRVTNKWHGMGEHLGVIDPDV